MQSYVVPRGQAEGRIVEKKSEFIAALAPVETESEALDFLEQVRARHRTARHNVYAYTLRENARSRYSDDGEPAKTAGLPVLSAIQHAGLENCIIVVTRYFGGTLLGTGGLVRAYTAAANAAIAQAGQRVIRRVCDICLQLAYARYEPVQRRLEQAGARVVGAPEFGQEVSLCARLPAEAAPALVQELSEALRGDARIQVGEAFFAPF